MKQNKFFARAASKALALAAAVMMMSAAFTACSKDSDNDNGGGTTPLPEPKAQTVTVDGVERSIVKVEYKDEGKGNYRIYLPLSEDRKEMVWFNINEDVVGNPVKLTERAKKSADEDYFYWVVNYSNSDDVTLIESAGNPGMTVPLFKTGTLEFTGSFKGTLNIRLKNGRIKGTDGKEHTITLSYSGKMTKHVPPQPQPEVKTVTLDGVEKTVQEGKCITKDLSNGDYTLLLYLSDNHKERVQLDLNKELHMTGSLINLDKREKEHDGKQYWVICYYTPSGGSAIVACAVPGSPYEVFKEGTLTVNGSPETGDFNIQLKDGRIKGTDGKEYTLAISYIGRMKTK